MGVQTADVVVVEGGVVGPSTAFRPARLGWAGSSSTSGGFWPPAPRANWGALVRMHYTNEPEARLARFGLDYFKNRTDLVGAGDCGTTLKTSPAVGLGLAEWVVKGRPETVDLRPFRASRFAEGKPIVGEHEYGDRDYDYARLKVILG